MPHRVRSFSNLQNYPFLPRRRLTTTFKGWMCWRTWMEDRPKKMKRWNEYVCVWQRCMRRLATLKRWLFTQRDHIIGSCRWRGKASRNSIRMCLSWPKIPPITLRSVPSWPITPSDLTQNCCRRPPERTYTNYSWVLGTSWSTRNRHLINCMQGYNRTTTRS